LRLTIGPDPVDAAMRAALQGPWSDKLLMMLMPRRQVPMTASPWLAEGETRLLIYRQVGSRSGTLPHADARAISMPRAGKATLRRFKEAPEAERRAGLVDSGKPGTVSHALPKGFVSAAEQSLDPMRERRAQRNAEDGRLLNREEAQLHHCNPVPISKHRTICKLWSHRRTGCSYPQD
jgi:hypothetical protein